MIKMRQPIQTSPMPDMTPLLDIIFILIVFLMLTAAVNLNVLEVNLPTAEVETASEIDEQSVTLNILEQAPHWAFNGQTFDDWQEFSQQILQAVAEDKSLVIGAEDSADIQYLVKLLTFLQNQNIQATQLLIEPN